jgi:ABC-type uncharacterized transport system permease subunit
MDALFGIPVLGFVLQLVAYLLDVIANGHITPIILALAAPIALGALCGIMNERSGIVNIGIEGMMLVSAFVGYMAALIVQGDNPTGSTAPFGASAALVVGVVAAVLAGMSVSALHAWLSITIRANQIISGTIINIVAVGTTSYLNRLLGPANSAGTFSTFNPPPELVKLPVVGWFLEMFLAQGPLAMSVIVLVVGLQIWLFRTRWGLRTRATGEHPQAADTVGINVIALRYTNVIIGGAFAGLAGAYLTLESTGTFQNEMTAGRGFIALAAVIFGRWTPIGAFGGALIFMASQALGVAIQLHPPAGDLGVWLSQIQVDNPSLYNNFFAGLPYLLTIIVLAGVVGRSIPPASLGLPYEKEGAH